MRSSDRARKPKRSSRVSTPKAATAVLSSIWMPGAVVAWAAARPGAATKGASARSKVSAASRDVRTKRRFLVRLYVGRFYTWRRMRHLLRVLGLTLLLLPAGSAAAQTPGGWWAQILRPADLWSGPIAPAESFGQLPRGHYVFVPDAQPFLGGGRVYVQEAAERAYGYVDAIALAPSGPPAELGGELPPVVASPLFRPFWVANHTATALWGDPNEGSESLGDLPPFTKLLVLAPAVGQRYYVQDARTERLGYVDAATIGPSDAPVPGEYDPPPSLVPPPSEPSFRPSWAVAQRATDLWS